LGKNQWRILASIHFLAKVFPFKNAGAVFYFNPFGYFYVRFQAYGNVIGDIPGADWQNRKMNQVSFFKNGNTGGACSYV